MKTFLIAANNAFTGRNLNEKDLPGAGGRMDIVCRCLSSALWLSGSLRNNTEFVAVLGGKPNPPMTLVFRPEKLKRISPDERSIAFAIKKALDLANGPPENARGPEKTINETPQGIEVQNKGFEETLSAFAKDKNVFFLDFAGTDIKQIESKESEKNSLWVLGDNKGLDPNQKKLLEKIKAKPVSLGNKEYLSSQCITFVNIELDHREQ
ncbi:MAG: tRNA (pseudouridine(54)-N(1))-methyltransferase TrmY [Candidatus Diapherotrites archaeon]|nr:tRNA (pseudouridine(54)-N(1))-methyltransferase TrmY [Candidatus Diapherotrites archaeon]